MLLTPLAKPGRLPSNSTLQPSFIHSGYTYPSSDFLNNRTNLLDFINKILINLEILRTTQRLHYGRFTAFSHKASERTDQETGENFYRPGVWEDAEDLIAILVSVISLNAD
jgi:hypothetical protein